MLACVSVQLRGFDLPSSARLSPTSIIPEYIFLVSQTFNEIKVDIQVSPETYSYLVSSMNEFQNGPSGDEGRWTGMSKIQFYPLKRPL